MKVAVIGAGSWGTAIAGLLGSKGYAIAMWARRPEVAAGITNDHQNPDYLKDFRLPASVVASTNMSECVAGANAIVLVAPSQGLRSVCEQMAPYVDPKVPVVVLTKGIERSTGYLMTDIAGEVLGHPERIAGLSGPNHAEEISKYQPAAAVVACYSQDVATFFQSLFSTDTFRVYTSNDVVGVEVCAAAKNIVAIAVGLSAGTGLGDNTAALIMTRGLAEMSRLVHALGGEAKTCMGLAGMGDLIATCTSENSRNRMFGVSFAKGESLEEYKARTHMVVEGALACISVREVAREQGVELPIADAVYDMLYNDVSFDRIVERMFARTPTQEFYGLDK